MKVDLSADMLADIERARKSIQDGFAGVATACDKRAALRQTHATLCDEIMRRERETQADDAAGIAALSDAQTRRRLVERDLKEADSTVGVAESRLHQATVETGGIIGTVALGHYEPEARRAFECVRQWCSSEADVRWHVGEFDLLDRVRTVGVMYRNQKVPFEPDRVERAAKERLRILEDFLAGRWPWPQ